MKIKLIRIIKDNPEDGQMSIKHLVGQEIQAKMLSNGDALAFCNGHLLIYEDEFEIVKI